MTSSLSDLVKNLAEGIRKNNGNMDMMIKNVRRVELRLRVLP